MATRDLLSVFGKYLDYFKGIEYDDFITLQPEHIKEAITDLVPRIKFENLFKRFMESRVDKDQTMVTNDSVNIADNSYIDVTNGTEVLDFASVVDPVFDEASFNITNTVTAPAGSFKILSSADIIIPTSDDVKAKIKTVQDIIDIPSIKLKIVITNYVNRNGRLSDYERVIVAKAIIHHLLVGEFCRVIKREEFISIAKLIVKLFPLELLGTYYIPAVKNHPAEGKLFNAYQNYKADLREAVLIPKRTKTLTTQDERPIQLAEKSEAFKIILEESEDFARIVETWNFCYVERQNLLNSLSVFEYVRKFPAFNLQNGYELLTLDARKLLGNKTSRLASIAPKIILYASQKKRNCIEVKNGLIAFKELSANLDDLDVLQQLTAVRLLPHLMPLGKKKLNKTTVAQLFCPFFKTECEAEKYNVVFKEDYKDNSLVLKPRLYFVGDLSSPSVHIYFADKNYIIESCMVGFDTLFKCFLGLNCSYPEETQHVWQFIQSEVYGIETQTVKHSSTVLTFMQDIRNIVTD